MGTWTWRDSSRKLADLLVVVWPLVFVLVVIVCLLRSFGTGSALDASTWPAIRKLAQERVHEPEVALHLRIVSYYSVVSFSVGLFLFFNSLIFLVRVKAINPTTLERKKSAHMISGLGVFLRGVVVFVIAIWMAKLVVVDPADMSPMSDERIVLFTFIISAVADLAILISLLLESGLHKLLRNRELIGALLYIDLPTIIGIWIIMAYAPRLLTTSTTPDMLFKAITGGAMIIHVVSSQLILSFLIAEEKLSELIGTKHSESSKKTPTVTRSTLPPQTSVAHSS